MGRLGVGLSTFAVATVALAGSALAAKPAAAQPPGVPAGLTKCSQGLDAWCGSVVVPLDRTGVIAGTTTVRFEWYPRSDTNQAPLTTIVASEGGPGYSTTASRDLYLDLYAPLRDRRALLLVDQRGTGLSDPLDCPEAQGYNGNWVANAEACGARLGTRSDLYTTANAAADLAAVLLALGVTSIDLYGDSYGSFFAQAFAVRYPALVRSLVLDATYPIAGLDPLYRTTATRLRENLSLICQRSAVTCPTTPADMTGLVSRVLSRLRTAPLATTAPDGAGLEVSVTLTPQRVVDVLLYTDSTPGWVREAPAALQALLDGNPRPLARMVAEGAVDATDGGRRPGGVRPNSELRSFSEGAYLAYACTDYPQGWDKRAPLPARQSQLASLYAGLPVSTFAPWATSEWTRSEFFVYDYCLRWPAPRAPEPPFPVGGRYPSTPTLVLNGDLDLRTDVYQARQVARNFPRSTYVEVGNAGHVTSVYDADACAAAIVRRFVMTLAAVNTSCVDSISEHRLVPRFAPTAAGIPEAAVASSADGSTAADRRVARVAVEAVADVIDRWYAIPGYSGVGLYGGQFTMTTTSGSPFTARIWSLKLNRVKWVQDVEVSGTGSMPRGAGTAQMSLTLKGSGTATGSLTVTWPTRAAGAQARITGSIGGRPIDLSVPAPSYY